MVVVNQKYTLIRKLKMELKMNEISYSINFY